MDRRMLITVDNCGIPDAMRAEVASRLSKKGGNQARAFRDLFLAHALRPMPLRAHW